MKKTVFNCKTSLFDNFQKWISRLTLRSDLARYVVHIIVSTLLGILAGFGAILFHHLLELMRQFFSPDNIHRLWSLDRHFVVFIPVTGGIICALMTRLFKDISKERGVMSVIKSIILNNGLIKLRITLFHLVAPIISIGTGAPLGPEGPAAKIGSGMGSFLSQTLKFSRDDMMMYTAAGAGAAISAVFNAPIAGVFFGIEVILLNDLKNRALSALIISSVVADILSRSMLGNKHLFVIPDYVSGGIHVFPFFVLLGVIAGTTSIFYFILDKRLRVLFDEKLKIRNDFVKLIPVTVVFGLILYKYYQLYGIGYSTINDVLAEKLPVTDVAVLLVLKVVFLSLFLRAGSYGGKFAPSLSIGAFLGFIFAVVAGALFNVPLDPVVFALCGMGGVLAGINSAPLTAIMLVFEVTNDYTFILPLMLVSVVSYLSTVYYNHGNVYHIELLEEGIDVSKRTEIDLLGRVKVSTLMHRDFDTVNDTMPFRELLKIMMSSRYGDVIVTDADRRLMGIVSLKDIRQAITDHGLVDLLIARDILQPVSPVTENEPVSRAIQNIEEGDVEIIPVVKSISGLEVIGILSHTDITHAYRTQLMGWKTNQFLIDYSQKDTRK